MDNEAEKTFAPMDLFDYLDMIRQLKEKYNHKQIGGILGWSESKINNHSVIINEILTEVLIFAKQYQINRVSEKLTFVSFNFTEGWFRTSGLYNLNLLHQHGIVRWFCEIWELDHTLDVL